MDLTLTAEQRLLVESARATLGRVCPPSHVRAMEADARGYDPALWRDMARLGWTGILIDEEEGGSAQSLLEAVLLLEEMGRVLLPAPFLATGVIVPVLLRALAERRWLRAIAAGELVATPALVEPGWRDEWGALACTFRDGTVSGTKCFVPFAASADVVLVVTTGPRLVAVEGRAQVACERQQTLGGDLQYAVRFDRAAGVDLGPVGHALERARLHAVVGGLAYAVGAAERALEITVEYAKTRVQFGRPIGSFQAVAHRCADMRSDVDALRYLVYQAAWSLAAGRPSELEVGVAKAFGNEALRRVFMHAHQVHGAIGFSTEHDLQLFTRRAKAIELAWGSASAHRERVARAMGLG
ncbi:MAG: acyl-CoA dehydrogenase family protein [Candidatus Binatia bacterium]